MTDAALITQAEARVEAMLRGRYPDDRTGAVRILAALTVSELEALLERRQQAEAPNLDDETVGG